MTLADLRVLCERATRGWHRGHDHLDNWIYDEQADWVAQVGGGSHDTAFIVAARTWLPALIEVATAARQVCDYPDIGHHRKLRAALARLDEVK